jgi:hypothetical protein
MMILLIAGSRSFDDEDLMEAKLQGFLSQSGAPDVIIHGGARGADIMGAKWAARQRIPHVMFTALWEQLSKRAGYLRNTQMADACTHAVVFWNGQSKGAKHMIDLLEERNIPARIVRF